MNYYLAMDDPKQTPYIHYGAGHEVEEIQILRPDGSIRLLPEVSEIVHAIVEANWINRIKKVYFLRKSKTGYNMLITTVRCLATLDLKHASTGVRFTSCFVADDGRERRTGGSS